jgi:hypothetical protein
MKQQIVRIGPHQAGKVMGILYFLVGLVAAAFMLVGAIVGTDKTGMVIFAVVAPFAYGVMGYLFSILGAALYNLIAGFVGGLEITVTVEDKTLLG